MRTNIHFLIGLELFLFFLIEVFTCGQHLANAGVEDLALKPDQAYTAENLRDPFSNPVQTEILVQPGAPDTNVPEVPLPAMKVQGIFWGGKFPQAIINDKIVKAGETIEGARIVSIEKNLVTVFFNNKQFILTSPATDNLAASVKNEGKKGGN